MTRTGLEPPSAPDLASALDLYDDALREGGPLRLQWGRRPGRGTGPAGLAAPAGGPGPARQELDLRRWCAPADATDQALLARCTGPTLDVGCGPGRLVVALARRGVPVLGVDVAPAAVAMSRASGGLVLRRSVFGPLPGEGRWAHVLLIDGNVGIGGRPGALLTRVHDLLGPGGRVHAEVEPEEVDEVATVTVQDGRGRTSSPFPWARLGASALGRRAVDARLHPVEDWTVGGRRFLALERQRGR